MKQKPGTKQSDGEKVIKDIRRATRKQYSSEEKIRIVLDGLKGEDRPSCNTEKGSNEKPSNPGACFIANPPHNQTNQMRQTLS